ncbi:hypothetical protein [Achromobacter dolens]|uniref:hypothetical protein n=1 Tax=Achromobacter dolens TaxID=1287738 RepID=UPI00300C52C5
MLGKIGSVKNSQSGLFDIATFGAPGLATRRALPNSAILQASGESGGRLGRAAKWLGISAWHFAHRLPRRQARQLLAGTIMPALARAPSAATIASGGQSNHWTGRQRRPEGERHHGDANHLERGDFIRAGAYPGGAAHGDD